MPAIESPMSGADQTPEMASVTIHDSRLNLSVMDIQKLARMKNQKNASIFYVQKDLGGLWRQVVLDEARTTKCLELLQQLAKELSPPAEEVPIHVLGAKQDQPKPTSAIKRSLSILPAVLRLVSISLRPQTKLPELLAPPISLDFPVYVEAAALPWLPVDVRLPEPIVVTIPESVVITLPEPVDVTEPESIDVAEPEPIDVAKPELPSHIKNHPRFRAIQEKMAAQIKVCGEKEIRIKEASENSQMRYGPWVKAIKKAGRDLKIEKGKLKKLRHEEERILVDIGE